MLLRNKTKIKGRIIGIITTLNSIGLRKLEDLREEFPERRKNPEYVRSYEELLEKHGHRKERVTWNIGVFIVMLQCAIRRNFEQALEVFRYEMILSHNIVTNEGDALIADHMSETDARTLVDNTNGHITVGTGWTGTTPKTNTAVNTPTGSPEIMDATYPKLKGTWGNTDDNVVQYRATFEAGDLNISGIDEAGLGNNATEASGDNLAYGQITPDANVTATDTLEITWEHTYLGA